MDIGKQIAKYRKEKNITRFLLTFIISAPFLYVTVSGF